MRTDSHIERIIGAGFYGEQLIATGVGNIHIYFVSTRGCNIDWKAEIISERDAVAFDPVKCYASEVDTSSKQVQ